MTKDAKFSSNMTRIKDKSWFQMQTKSQKDKCLEIVSKSLKLDPSEDLEGLYVVVGYVTCNLVNNIQVTYCNESELSLVKRMLPKMLVSNFGLMFKYATGKYRFPKNIIDNEHDFLRVKFIENSDGSIGKMYYGRFIFKIINGELVKY